MKIPRAKFSLRYLVSKPAFKVVFSSLIVLALLVGGAVAYVWYVGKYGPKVESVVDEPISRPKPKLPEPAKLDPDGSIGVSIQSLSSPVAPGENASLIVKSYPEASCSIRVTHKEEASTDSGLVAKKADIYGMITWTWTVEPSGPVGEWSVKVICSHHNKKAKVIGDFIVKEPKR